MPNSHNLEKCPTWLFLSWKTKNILFFFRVVLGFANRILGLQRGQQKWSVESVHTKNIVSILHLLVALARHFRYKQRYIYIFFFVKSQCLISIIRHLTIFLSSWISPFQSSNSTTRKCCGWCSHCSKERW